MNVLRKMAGDVVRWALRLDDPTGWTAQHMVGDAGEPVNEGSVMTLSACWACVNLLMGTQASLPIMVYRTAADGSLVAAKDHQLYRILHDSPNFDQTAVDFWEFICGSIELWGNGFARIDRSRTGIVSLWPIGPDRITVRRRSDGKLSYRWTEEGRSFEETEERVLHIRGPGGNPLGGMSTLTFARNTFSSARAAERAAAGMFKNGLRPSGVLSSKEWLSGEHRAIAEAKLADKFLGAMNAGRPMMLEGGMTWQQLTISPEDAQMLESRTFSVEEICRFFGVPPHMVGHTSKSTSWGTGIEQQTLGFLKFTLRRRLKRIEQALEKQLLTPVERAAGLRIEFNLEGLLRADSAGRASFYQTMTGMGAMTINEVRRLENLPPVPGGDEPRMQMQNVPITAAPEKPALPPPDEENTDAQV